MPFLEISHHLQGQISHSLPNSPLEIANGQKVNISNDAL